MPGLIGVQLDCFSTIETHGEHIVLPETLHGSEVAGAKMRFPVRCGELDALAYSKITLLFAVHGTLPGQLFQERGIVGNLVAITGSNGQHVGTGIDGENGGCAVIRDAVLCGTAGFVVNLDRRVCSWQQGGDCRSPARPESRTERLSAASRPCAVSSARMSCVSSCRSAGSGATNDGAISCVVYARARRPGDVPGLRIRGCDPAPATSLCRSQDCCARKAATACCISVVEPGGRKSTAAVFEMSVASRWPSVSALFVYMRTSSEARETAT